MPGDASIEVRVALVMTGGVSLAVWIGGVAAEVYRASRKHGLYRSLLEAMSSDVTIDVISGASAGGLNGVFLGAALSRDLEVEEFDELRDVWLRTGSLDALFRNPRTKNPPSLMKGDDYFAVQIENVLRGWLGLRDNVLDEESPLDLIMTATTITPSVVERADDLGQRIAEPVHRARFHFTADHLAMKARPLAKKMALAARTSASFPGAFEASFIPIGGVDDDSNIDMNGIASFDRTMWAMDGGVLMNKPVSPALEALKKRTSDRHGRRLMLYVNPDPGQGAVAIEAKRDEPPTLLTVVSKALLTLPRVESIAADLNEIREQNAKLSIQRDTRFDLLERLTSQRLLALGRELYPLWLRRRDYEAVDRRLKLHFDSVGGDLTKVVDNGTYLWEALANGLRDERMEQHWLGDRFPTTTDVTAGHEWRYGYLPLDYFASVGLDLFRRAIDLLPTAESALRSELQGHRAVIQRYRRALMLLRAVDDDYWVANLRLGPQPRASFAWSPMPDEESTNATAYAARLYGRWPAPPSDLAAFPANTQLDPANPDTRRFVQWRDFLVGITRGYATEPLGQPSADDADRFATDWLANSARKTEDEIESLRGELRTRELELARGITATIAAADEIVGLATGRATGSTQQTPRLGRPDERTRVDVMSAKLTAADPASAAGDHVAEVLRRMFALYVLHSMSDQVDEREVRLEFVQVSANANCPIDPTRLEASDKVAGLQLGHFGAFYKESWRANDWMWGRLDGTSSLVAALVDPIRVRRQFQSAADAGLALRRVGVGDDLLLADDDRRELVDRWERAQPQIEAELDALFGAGPVERATSLSTTHAVLIAAFQLLICRDELPVVANSVQNSQLQGAETNPAAQIFVRDVNAERGGVPLHHARRLLIECTVGREKIHDEIGSDALTDTATTAAAVVASIAAGDSGGLKVFRHLFATIRRVVVWVYVLAQNAIRRSRSAFALTQLLLAFGAGVIAVKMSGGDVPAVLSLIAIVALVVWAVITSLTVGAWWAVPSLLLTILVVGWSSLNEEDARNSFGGLTKFDATMPDHVAADRLSSPPGWRLAVAITTLVLVALAALLALLWYAGHIGKAKRAATSRATTQRLGALFRHLSDTEQPDERRSIFAVLVDTISEARRPLRNAVRGVVVAAVLGVIGAPLLYLAVHALLGRTEHQWLITTTTWMHRHQALVILGGLPLVFVIFSLLSNRTRFLAVRRQRSGRVPKVNRLAVATSVHWFRTKVRESTGVPDLPDEQWSALIDGA